MRPRVFEVSYTQAEGLTVRVRPPTIRLLPESTMGHLRQANRELLLAVRSVLDEAIGVVERRQAQAEQAAAGRRPRRVHVRAEGEEQAET